MASFVVVVTLSGNPPFLTRYQQVGPFILEALSDGSLEQPKLAFNSKDLSVTAYLVSSQKTASQINTRLYSPPQKVGGTNLETRDTVYIAEIGPDYSGPNMFTTWIKNRTTRDGHA